MFIDFDHNHLMASAHLKLHLSIDELISPSVKTKKYKKYISGKNPKSLKASSPFLIFRKNFEADPIIKAQHHRASLTSKLATQS